MYRAVWNGGIREGAKRSAETNFAERKRRKKPTGKRRAEARERRLERAGGAERGEPRGGWGHATRRDGRRHARRRDARAGGSEGERHFFFFFWRKENADLSFAVFFCFFGCEFFFLRRRTSSKKLDTHKKSSHLRVERRMPFF